MPFQADDRRALQILSSGKQSPEVNSQIQSQLGLDDDDVRAWQISQKPETPSEIKQALEDRIIDKIETQKALTPSQISALAAGAAQGVTFGFADEIVAGAKAGVEALKGKGIKESFDKKVKQERAELKRLEEKHPISFIAGELAGAIAVPVPGAAALKGATTTAKALGKGAQLATESALFSAGKAEAPLGSKQFLKEVAEGTALGVGGGALLGGSGKAARALIKKGDKPVKKAAQLVSNVLFDLPSSYTEKLLNKRTAQKILNPKSSKDVVDSLMDMTKSMGEHSRALSIKATDKLSDKRTINVDDIISEFNNIESIKKVNRSTMGEAQKATKVIKNASEDLVKRGGDDGLVSEKDLKRFIQDIDLEIPWNKNEWQPQHKALADIRANIDHGILKKNKAYADAMVPVAEITRNLKDISKSFSLKREGFKTVSSDATFSKIKGFFDVSGAAKKPVTEKAVKQAEERFLGPGKPTLLEDIQLGQIAARTEGGQAAGSRNVLMGLIGGGAIGLPIWGGVVGAVKDKYGRKIGKQVLPAVTSKLEKGDELLKSALEKVDPEQLDRVLRTIGRVKGAEIGVEAQQAKPSLIP